MLARDARPEWLAVLGTGAMLAVADVFLALTFGPAWLIGLPIVIGATAGVLAMFRDPDRRPPSQRGALVSPVDGRVSSVHDIDHHPPFDGPARCVRVFISLLDVHVVRAPLHGRLAAIEDQPGQFINALRAESPELNTARCLVVRHPARDQALASIRLVAGAFARTIHLRVMTGEVLQRSQRIGIIKLGSTAELYVPLERGPEAQVAAGDRVRGGETVLMTVAVAETTVEEAAARKRAGAETEIDAEPEVEPEAEPEAESGAEAALLPRVGSKDEQPTEASSADDSVPQDSTEADAEEVEAAAQVEEVVWEEQDEERVAPASEMQLTLGPDEPQTDDDTWGIGDESAKDDDGLVVDVEVGVEPEVAAIASEEETADDLQRDGSEPEPGPDANTALEPEPTEEPLSTVVDTAAAESDDAAAAELAASGESTAADQPTIELAKDEPVVEASTPDEPKTEPEPQPTKRKRAKRASRSRRRTDRPVESTGVETEPTPQTVVEPPEPEPQVEPEPPAETGEPAPAAQATPESATPDAPAEDGPSPEAAAPAEPSTTPSHGQRQPHPRRPSARQRKAKRKRR